MIGLMSISQFNCVANLYTHMQGLIFETSIWLLAGSTRFENCLECLIRIKHEIHIHIYVYRILSIAHKCAFVMLHETAKLPIASALCTQHLTHNVADIATHERHASCFYHIVTSAYQYTYHTYIYMDVIWQPHHISWPSVHRIESDTINWSMLHWNTCAFPTQSGPFISTHMYSMSQFVTHYNLPLNSIIHKSIHIHDLSR